MTDEEYTGLLTSAHGTKPRFVATVSTITAPCAKLQAELVALRQAFDLDTAIGVQLDTIGLWVGQSRRVPVPLTGVYFAWGGAPSVGWGAGVWKGQFDPATALVDLPDDLYRALLKAKVILNRWSGSYVEAYAAWLHAFGPEHVVAILDHQDMSMTISMSGTPLSEAQRALIVHGAIHFKPHGVRVNYVTVPADGPAFAWGVPTSPGFAGWGTGQLVVNL